MPLVMVLAACSSLGPANVESGQYRLYATSASGEELPPDVSLVIEDAALTLSSGAEQRTYILGDPGAEYTVCPPSGQGAPQPLGGAVSIGDLDLADPAVFGDCGKAKPSRVTVVDLSSVDEVNQFPFERWAEFCLIEDPDCS
jgi:hypothetical protein